MPVAPTCRRAAAIVLLALATTPGPLSGSGDGPAASLSLQVGRADSAIHDLNHGDVRIRGHIHAIRAAEIHIRVTTGRGRTVVTSAPVRNHEFSCRYPRDFAGAMALSPTLLFVDASPQADFDAATGPQAEACLIVYDARQRRFPDLPSAFTNDLFDAKGRRDESASEWPAVRTLTNLYLHSRAARLAGVGRPEFDLNRPGDLQTFKARFTLYDFDNRDRDWSMPLGHRAARTFWQAVWDRWFNASNDNPRDGDANNAAPSNYLPYTFSNDFSDILISYLMRQDATDVLDDNLDAMCREGIENLLAMQHHGNSNFAHRDSKGREGVYTDGAFRYGMFVNGDFLVEGTGWFYNPNHTDYVGGGVFNGRAAWALGEALKRYPDGELGDRLRKAMRDVVRFCLIDARGAGYARKTPNGHVYWRDVGESAYLLLGMLAACEVDPGLKIDAGRTLKGACVTVLDALAEKMKPCGQWSIYADHDSMILAALADGVRILHDHPHAARWRACAIKAADGWIGARVDRGEYPHRPIHFAARIAPDRMSYLWGGSAPGVGGRTHIFFYKTGHWIHALAKMYRMTGDRRYLRRADRMVKYLCGDNPFRVRILSELGGVYNWVEDTDGDGIEDKLQFDMYPESTAFCDIGIMHLLEAMATERRGN